MSGKDYLDSNKQHWEKGYRADNVESWVFRFYGRVLRDELGITGERQEKLLDFGCGQGTCLRYFKELGFDVFGVDISSTDLKVCRDKMPEIADHFIEIPPKPLKDDVFAGGNFDVVLAVQSLYYYSSTDLEVRMQSLYNQMKDGGIIYASMMGTKCGYFKFATHVGDGIYNVNMRTKRLSCDDYFMNFTTDENDLLKKFHLFKPLHIGYYDMLLHEDEGSTFHYVFIGQK